MNLPNLINTIKTYTPNDITFRYGSIYEILNATNVEKYPMMVVSLEKVRKNIDSIVTYDVVIYYADRLNEDASNEIYVESDALTILKVIIKHLEDDFGITDFDIYPFTQKFADLCSGAWCRVSIEAEDEIDYCEEDNN